MADSGESRHYLELDGMRGVLAVTIMLFHLGLNTVLSDVTGGLLRNGLWPLCVDFFFVLSGFVLCRSMVSHPPRLAGYAAKRLFRLAPMFLLTTGVALAVTGLAQWSGAEIVANLAIAQSLFGLRSINFPSWSIPFELFLPAAGLWLVPAAKRMPTLVLAASIVGLLLSQALAVVLLACGKNFEWLRAGVGLALGGVLYLFRQRLGHASTNVWAPLVCVALSLVVMAVGGEAHFAAAIFPLLTVGAIWSGANARGLFSTAPAQALGRWSYSIYLLHIPTLLLAQAWLGQHGTDGLVAKIALAGTVIGAAAASWRFIERPFIRLGYRAAG